MAKELLSDKPTEKKASKLSFLKEKGALKKWLIATEILGRRK